MVYGIIRYDTVKVQRSAGTRAHTDTTDRRTRRHGPTVVVSWMDGCTRVHHARRPDVSEWSGHESVSQHWGEIMQRRTDLEAGTRFMLHACFTVQRLHGRVGTGTGAQALTQRTLPGFSGYKMYTCFIRQGTTNQTNQPTTSPRFPPPFFSATIMYACDPFLFFFFFF